MKADFWFAITWFILGAGIMIYFLIKIGKAVGSPWWLFYPLFSENFSEEQKRVIKKQQRKMGIWLITLFLSFVIIGLIFFKPK